MAELYTLADAAAFGTESVLYGMAQTLLAAGVVPVYAAAAGEDYAAALAALETEENLFAVVCDGGAEALCAHVDACCAAGRERVGLLAGSGTEAARETAAAADNRRVAVLCDGGDEHRAHRGGVRGGPGRRERGQPFRPRGPARHPLRRRAYRR